MVCQVHLDSLRFMKNDKRPHPFTTHAKQELNQSMTGYRYISDVTKRNSIENMAEDLIKDAVRIFKFRLLVQEPKCEARWFKNNVKINTQFMKGGQWDDKNLDDYVVKICYFPLIGMELNVSSKIKVCAHAKVFSRMKNLIEKHNLPQEKKTRSNSQDNNSENLKLHPAILYDNLQDADDD